RRSPTSPRSWFRIGPAISAARSSRSTAAPSCASEGRPMAAGAAGSVDSFDYVIVGAGSAGSVLANRLTEDGKATVCVLEAGPRDWHPFIHIPAGFMKTLVHPGVNWLYKTEAGAGIDGRSIH